MIISTEYVTSMTIYWVTLGCVHYPAVTVSFIPGDYNISEGVDSTVELHLVRIGPKDAPVSVNVVTVDGTALGEVLNTKEH